MGGFGDADTPWTILSVYADWRSAEVMHARGIQFAHDEGWVVVWRIKRWVGDVGTICSLLSPGTVGASGVDAVAVWRVKCCWGVGIGGFEGDTQAENGLEAVFTEGYV